MMTKIIVLVISVLGVIHSGAAQIIQPGQCEGLQQPDYDNYDPATFDPELFTGTWYELRRSENNYQSGDCSYFEFTATGAGYQVSYPAVTENFYGETNGTAIHVNGTATYTVTLTNIAQPFDVKILRTDYNSYAVAYTCRNVDANQRAITVWELLRQSSYPNVMLPFLINTTLIQGLDINVDALRSVDQSEQACYILPVLSLNEPVILPGTCDLSIPVVQNFDPEKFQGLWHEIGAYYSESSQNQCSRAEYTLANGVVQVQNSQVVNQTLDIITGTATVISTDQSAKLSVVLNVGGTTVTTELWVLSSDYENYAVSYSCVNLPNNQKRVYSWILSRTRQISAESQAAVDSVIASQLVLNKAYYRQTDQSDDGCFFYPEPSPEKPVVFRGQCNPNIPVVQNFDPFAYQGIWHDIESYPSAFQFGTCRNAEYTLDTNTLVVDVLNTQVLGDTLDTIRGTAVLASNDGSGLLDVTFPIVGTNATITTNYYVLDTDYYSYSLVYACSNINADEYQVLLWKLSRTKQLSPEASANITSVISNYNIMDQRYFVPVDHSVDACFYYPTPQPGVPVVFPGQCDQNVSVVQNFNLGQFIGVWYEIEAYPKDQQQGQCINHDYSTGTANTLNLTSTQVVNQFLTVSEGTFSFATNDNSAKMQIDIIVDGEVITIPFWILSIDYGDHALAYSCVNRGLDFRAIYSWKLSRTRQLSANAVTAMNNVINNVEVLGNQYYEPIDQSLDACFFLPELAPGEPVILVGQCDTNISVVQNFDVEKYLGTWRLIESYPADFQTGTCNQANYGATDISNTISVVNNQVVNQTLATTTGGQAVASADGSAKLQVTFASSSQPQELWILDTDYDTYSLVYSCSNLDANRRRVWSWKMSRTPSLSQTAVAAINQVVNSVQVLNNAYYYTVDNSEEGCFYFPEPDFTRPVRFRGRCDQNITVVQNFDAALYLGVWHNIELYPTGFQEGTCNNADYSLGPDGVIVFNTEVVNQTLSTITGLAVPVSTDGSAILDVSFPTTNVTTPYWVLATDYYSYSLVYSCVEIDEEYKNVWSWKLSRTRQLTPAANTAINNAIAQVQVLAPQYYRTADQSPEACFYYPEPVPGVPVRFPGKCDNNIPVQQNFNLSLFEGIWHEIQAYPKEQQTGQCVNHEYSAGSGNYLELVSASVSNLTLALTNGNFSFTTTDNSAKMSITINSDGQIITIPFWVLATDYNDYAIAYACVDEETVNDMDYRKVFSWKLSRTKQLSPNAVNSINDVIARVDVLDNKYYENIDQSDEACFFLPEVLPGEEVIFPGKCDENLNVMQNFNPANYTGRWFLIESYPSVHQDGTCNDASYTAGANNVINVVNTQVLNQKLASISGTAVTASNDGSGKLLVTFPSSPTPRELWILDTDYTSYSLVYSCRNINADQRAVWSWKLSRDRTGLSNDAVNAINQVINRVNVLDDRYYYQIDRSEEACFYFPEPDFSRPIRFRGRCNQNISVVQNFDAGRYLGVWHNIELYPTGFQEGTCNNAEYSLGPDGVIVFNTEVVNQTLSTITGLAVPVSNDGSAILDVTFPTTPLITPYWVLATDYDSYSLVYSCIELDEEYKNVWSWKLSRTRQVTLAATTAINNAIAQVQVLDSQYYKVADQSPEACFYYPEPVPGVPVRFPGKCDNNIPVEQNFNLTMFEGIWHEIQAYPKEQQTGQCVNHEYTAADGNYLQLVSASVSNLTLALTNGNFTFTTTDNSAKMSITITNSNGQIITIPFWILDTDYSDYALAYACVDEETVNDMDYRRVFSWKLSRTKSLSPDAVASIDAVINSVDVLRNDYYEDIDQSDAACFFLPEYLPGEPVIFPGQCDPNVPVVQNFNATAYLGRWRTIELYHADFNTGECSEAQYSPLANGNVQVTNSHVISQSLFTANAVAVPAADGSAKWEVTFGSSSTPAQYWVLDTDYDSYSLVYTCRNINAEQRRVGAWKLSRERTLSPAANAAINQVIDKINVLDNRYFRNMVQNDAACFYYPEADGTPVIFRGQCDNNVAVVSNFDANKYQGTWYDIESYPTGFQGGTCNTAQYTLNGGVVEVFNTQVVDQELDTIKATAVPAVTDGSAKLIVTFPAGPGATIDVPYWVLDTDYESYSLVYSCENIDNERQRVTSWKLSRYQYLTNASNTAINAVMERVPVLRQQYYLERDHSYDGCFYYPDNLGGPIIYYDGQCPPDNQVNTVQNFDADRFTGPWHEVARFPSLQPGTCTTSTYSIGTNGSQTLTQTFVVNERLDSLIGPAVVAPNGAGIISISISGQVTINNNFYIIDTDYSNYALLYACSTLTNSSRQVFSWKLSRTRDGFSPAIVEHIDKIVREEVDLHRSYYEVTPQDDDSCFYYPVFDELPNSIQLPGPCPNIAAVANFNVGAYVGRWFDVERYPQPNQRGTCNRARYEELSPTAFSVFNYQVLGTDTGPSLSSISGTATVSSTDGTGALTVTLQNGQRVNTLYVLDTDYDNFAFLYNCRNLDNGWRQVASWKLSRTTSLSTAAQNTINAIINNTQGLTPEYYKPTNQSEEACFFIPAFNPNEKPQFRARCEAISGMQNFDINRYAGWWHEFESYPTGGDRGQCASARYSVAAGSVRYEGVEVVPPGAVTTTGTVTVHPNGRLEKTLSNGQVENLWVLDTDYETYSVVISCEEVDDEFARIWSAKYRKTPTLTVDIVIATDAVVASHPLLYQDLYRYVDQTDAACFHLPQPNGERVVLRGRCDENIPVQNNFEIGDYTGTWYQIERYPYAEVRAESTCIGARYTLREGTDVVTVLNWEVFGGELETIEGLGTVVGNAKIQVQLPTPGSNQTTTQDLYILDTDYVSYSLAYTCEQLNPFQRAVVAFKLSRTRTLPAAGVSAINTAISARPELHQPYFIAVEQNDDCDEPSSSYLVKSSVLVILLCYVMQTILQ